MPKAKPQEPAPLQTYGLGKSLHPHFDLLSREQQQLEYEMRAFRCHQPIDKGGLTRYQHFRNGAKILWPWLKWNPWAERMCEAFCAYDHTGLAGCASSGKTTVAVIYGVFWWLCGIQDSAMVLTSTTKNNIRSRAWNWVQKLYTQIPGPRIGNMVDSRTTWQAAKGDDRHCVCALAVREGSTQKAVGRIQGFHPDGRMLVIIDESTDTPEAIFESFPNLIAGNWEFQSIAIGNPASHFDPHGKYCEPKNGWSSVTVEDDQWETKPHIDGKAGICIHFDAEKSPNVEAGQVIYEHLPKLAQLEGVRKKYGAESPQYYKFWRGFWCPDGIIQTVLTESLLQKFESVGAQSKHVFAGGNVFNIAGCDPAFGGGDRPILKFAKMGELADGTMGIQLTERVALTFNSKLETPLHYQLAQQIKWHCNERGVSPENFGLDSTGEGGGLADILWREWSSKVIRVEFGGKPSDERVSNEDERPCDEVYTYRVAELWFLVKELIVSGQLKGMQPDEAKEFCNRLWRLKGNRIDLEPKSRRKGSGDAVEESSWGMAERYGKSPDLADAVAVLCQVAKKHGAVVKPTGQTARRSSDWINVARKHDEIYADPSESEFPESQQYDRFAMEEL